LQNETIWLTQQKIADLFGVQRPAVTKHLKNIFETAELNEEVVSSILEHTTSHGAIKGKTQETTTRFYNLDAIISVGYRVNSSQATAFRIWATERLKEYITKGFTMDDERLKNPNNIFGNDYYEEQLARICKNSKKYLHLAQPSAFQPHSCFVWYYKVHIPKHNVAGSICLLLGQNEMVAKK